MSATIKTAWKLVPAQPTEDMLRAGLEADAYGRDDIHSWDDPQAVYASMLAAAPAPPQEGEMPELPEVPDTLRDVWLTSPKRVWLDVGDDPGNNFRDLEGVTWSEDNATGWGIAYVRADVASLAAERVPEPAALPAEVEPTDPDPAGDNPWTPDVPAKDDEAMNGRLKKLLVEGIVHAHTLAAPIAAQPAAADGWKLVPVEPTDDMEAAAEDDYEINGETFPDWKSKWRAMIAAAPAQPAPEPAEPCPIKPGTQGNWRCDWRCVHAKGHTGQCDWTTNPAAPAQAAAVPEQTVGSALTDEVLENLQALRCSISGDCYNGKEWELQTIDDLRATLSRPTAAGEAEPKSAQAADKDAARYRWLRTRDVTFETEDGPEFVSYIPELGNDGSKLDAAIDAAIESIDRRAGQ